jgi:diaminopimelate epimerase
MSLFTLYSPGGNPTLLIDNRNNRISRTTYATFAQYLLEEYPCEQVGYIESPSTPNTLLHLEMMGGEYCINALLCAGKWAQDFLNQENCILSSSGSNNLQTLTGKNNQVSLRLSPPTVLAYLGAYAFPGILHWTEEWDVLPDDEYCRSFLQDVIKKAPKQDAYGYIPYQKTKAGIRIKPLIYVPATESWIFETACGSGSVAASMNAEREKIRQPSGSTIMIKKTSKQWLLSQRVQQLPLEKRTSSSGV